MTENVDNSQGYEKSDVAIRGLFLWGGGIVVALTVIILLLDGLFIATKEEQVYESELKPESVSLRELRAQESAALDSYKMIDPIHNVVQIPIDRAMQLLADEAFAKQKKQMPK